MRRSAKFFVHWAKCSKNSPLERNDFPYSQFYEFSKWRNVFVTSKHAAVRHIFGFFKWRKVFVTSKHAVVPHIFGFSKWRNVFVTSKHAAVPPIFGREGEMQSKTDVLQ